MRYLKTLVIALILSCGMTVMAENTWQDISSGLEQTKWITNFVSENNQVLGATDKGIYAFNGNYWYQYKESPCDYGSMQLMNINSQVYMIACSNIYRVANNTLYRMYHITGNEIIKSAGGNNKILFLEKDPTETKLEYYDIGNERMVDTQMPQNIYIDLNDVQILEDSNSNIWIASSYGVYKYNGTWSRISNGPAMIGASTNGNIYLSYNGSGMGGIYTYSTNSYLQQTNINQGYFKLKSGGNGGNMIGMLGVGKGILFNGTGVWTLPDYTDYTYAPDKYVPKLIDVSMINNTIYISNYPNSPKVQKIDLNLNTLPFYSFTSNNTGFIITGVISTGVISTGIVNTGIIYTGNSSTGCIIDFSGIDPNSFTFSVTPWTVNSNGWVTQPALQFTNPNKEFKYSRPEQYVCALEEIKKYTGKTNDSIENLITQFKNIYGVIR